MRAGIEAGRRLTAAPSSMRAAAAGPTSLSRSAVLQPSSRATCFRKSESQLRRPTTAVSVGMCTRYDGTRVAWPSVGVELSDRSVGPTRAAAARTSPAARCPQSTPPSLVPLFALIIRSLLQQSVSHLSVHSPAPCRLISHCFLHRHHRSRPTRQPARHSKSAAFALCATDT